LDPRGTHPGGPGDPPERPQPGCFSWLGATVPGHRPHYEDHAYFKDLYHSYRDFSTHTKAINLRVLRILLNKFDQWGRTSKSREVMMNRHRSAVFQEVVNRFRSTFGIAVQFGYVSLTQREHTPYNNLIVKEFLAALDKQQ
jgi:hypothetical protein